MQYVPLCNTHTHTRQPPAEVEDEAARKEAEEGEELVPKTPEPKEWVGQGSDLEILDGSVKPGRTLVRKGQCVCVTVCVFCFMQLVGRFEAPLQLYC